MSDSATANKARALARSGNYRGWADVERALGVPLSETLLRGEIDRLCKESAARTGDA
jgi:hypothetical protein